MRNIAVLLLLFLLCSQQTAAQDQNKGATTNTAIRNQGDHEDALAKQIFAERYKRKNFKVFKDVVQIDSNTFKYGGLVLRINVPKEMKQIFAKGILYPQIIHEYYLNEQKVRVQIIDSATEISTLPSKSKINPDFMSISFIEEMKFIENTPAQKRLKFWVVRKGLLNPIEYYVELSNHKATTNTSLAAFFKGAKLTFIEQGTLIY